MPHYEVPLDEFLESANEAILSQKKTVNELLAKAERVLTKKIKTTGDARDAISLINSEGQKFNDCLKILAAAHTKYESGKMSKEDFNETTKNAIVLLKKNCSNLQIKLGNVVSDTKAVTAKDIADFKEYLTGLKKIVNNRLKYLNSMPASESVFNDNDEENFSRHWIFAKEGDGSEDIEMDDPLGSDDDKDKDEDDDDKKKSKKSKSKKESDSDDDEDDDKDDDKKSKSKKKDDDDDKDDSESGFADGEDPDDKKSDDSDDDDNKKDKDDEDKECDDDECDDKDCKKSKSKKKDDDDNDKDDESESKESATFNTVLENFVKNTSDYGKEAALETFFSDCEYLSSINPSNKDEAIAKENATMMLNNRRNNEEVTMESISIVSALMDNYLYNCENYGVDAANEQLASDVSYQESAAMEGNVGREAKRAYTDGDRSSRYTNYSNDLKNNAHTKKDLWGAEKYARFAATSERKNKESSSMLPFNSGKYANGKCATSVEQRSYTAKAGAISGKARALANNAKNNNLPERARKLNRVADRIDGKFYSGDAINGMNEIDARYHRDAYDSGYKYAQNKMKSSKESALLDELCENFIYNEDNFGLETAFAYLESDLDAIEMPEIEAIAMEGNADAPIYNGGAAFVGGPGFNTPGQYTMQRYSTGDWVSNAIDARLSNDTRVARDTCASINKSDAKKMAAIANKMTKLNSKKKTADDAKKKTKIDAKLRKLKLSADAINETRKTMRMNPLSFESALAAYDANDPTIAAYEAVLDEIISRVDDYDFDEAMEGSDKFIMTPGKYDVNGFNLSGKDINDNRRHWLSTAVADRVNPTNLQGRLDYKYAEKSDKKDIKKMAAAAKKIEKLKIKAAKETNPKKLAQIKVQIKKLGVVASSINNARKKAGLDPIAFEAAISANINVFDGSFRAYDEALEMLINTEDDLSAEFCDLDYED